MVDLRVTNGVARLTLADADRRNAIDPAWVASLERAVLRLQAAEDARAVLITAEGPAFSVGGDLRHFVGSIDDLAGQLDTMVGSYHQSLATLADLPVPVIVAAQGSMAGGALGLLWCADLVLLADDAVLAPAFARLGLSGDGGSSWYLPRMIGMRRALRLLVQSEVLDARAALEWDLADRIVPRAELADAATEAAQDLAAGPTRAFGEIRRLVRDSFDRPLSAGLEAEHQATVRCGATADAREGMLAFSERRTPTFRGV